MSAKLCDHCGRPIVFGKDYETGAWVVLEVGGMRIYRKRAGSVVERDPQALVTHQCGARSEPPAERHFSEPQGAN